MEVKRRRLEVKPSETNSAENPSPLVDQLSSDDDNVVLKTLMQLKKKFNTSDEVTSFLSSNQQFIQTLLVMTKRYFSNLSIQVDAIKLRLIKESVAVLANCCYLSLSACVKIMQPGLQLGLLAVRILESGDRTDVSIKASILRLIANVCRDSQLAKTIASISTLLDRIMMSIIIETSEISGQALRIVGLLVKSPTQAKKIIESNGCYYLGIRLSKYELANLHQAELLQEIFNSLTEHRPRDVGRQLANSECASLFLDVILSSDLPNSLNTWTQIILKLVGHSFEIRESFGQQGAIQRALELPRIHGYICEFICYFAQDAWGRLKLRESGALNKILENLQHSTKLEEQQNIISCLKNFSHDQLGLSYLCHSSDFIDFLLAIINKFLSENKVECNVEIVQDDASLYRPHSPEFRHLAKRLKETTTLKHNNTLLHKDFCDVSQSPKSVSPPHRSWSPSMSPSSSFSMSPSSSYGSLSPTGDRSIYSEGSTSPVQFFVGDELGSVDEGIETDDKEKDSIQIQIMTDAVIVLSMLSHQDVNHIHLIKENVMTTLIDYISDAKRFNYRLARSITRLSRNPNHLQQLIDMNFHEIVIHKLIRRICFLTRFAKRCARCEMRRKFGRDLLQEFSTHVDKPIGLSLLQVGLKNMDENKRIDSLIASMVLIRTYASRTRFFHNYMPLESFTSILEEILLDSESFMVNEEIVDMRPEKFHKGFPLCWRVISVLSSMISRKTYDEVMEIDAIITTTDSASNMETGIMRPENTEPGCVVDQIHGQDMSKLEFRTKSDGRLISFVPKSEFCTSNCYFQGMFGNEFMERIEDRQVFQFDETTEHCTVDDFRIFLHYLSGCQSPSDCVRIDSVETCVSLLYLSDKYLCGQLTDYLLRQNGPAKRLLTGSTLKDFLPCILSVSNVRRRLGYLAILVLLRFSTYEQLRTVLGQFSGNRLAVDSFLELLKDFLIFCTHNTLPHQSSNIWL